MFASSLLNVFSFMHLNTTPPEPTRKPCLRDLATRTSPTGLFPATLVMCRSPNCTASTTPNCAAEALVRFAARLHTEHILNLFL
jgi:hypothetical protein